MVFCLRSQWNRHAELASGLRGPRLQLPKILEPLAPLRENLLLFSGLKDHNAEALGDGPGDHARAAASFLTGVHPRKTAGSDISVGISVDQVAAQKMGSITRLASLELGCEDGHLAGNCDSGYACAYVNSISWRSPTVPNPPEVNPRRSSSGSLAPTKMALIQRRGHAMPSSIKAFWTWFPMIPEACSAGLGNTDRRKLDEYLTAVREVERQVQMAEKQAAENTFAAPGARQTGRHSARLWRTCQADVQSDGDRFAVRHHAHFHLDDGAAKAATAAIAKSACRMGTTAYRIIGTIRR